MYSFGLSHPPTRIRLRRKSRNSKKRRLRGWRRARAVHLRELFGFNKHWSEKKNMKRFFNLSAYQRPRFVKRFLRTAVRTLTPAFDTTSPRSISAVFGSLSSESAHAPAPLQTISFSHMTRSRNLITRTKFPTLTKKPAKKPYFHRFVSR